MNDESDVDDLLNELDLEPSLPASGKTSPRLKPGEVDAVRVRMDEDEVGRVAAACPDSLSEVIQAILSEHKDDFEHLCHYFVESDARYTLDEGSLEIEECWMDENGSGSAFCGFTQSFYAGCRDRNVDADHSECELDLALNRADRTITISTVMPHEREPDEF
jgi:hypothetical protein